MYAQLFCFSKSSFSHCLRCAAMDSALLKAIQEGSLSPEVMQLLEAKFREQTAANVPHEGSSPTEDVDSEMPPPPPPPLPPSSSLTVAASPTKWVIVSEKGQANDGRRPHLPDHKGWALTLPGVPLPMTGHPTPRPWSRIHSKACVMTLPGVLLLMKSLTHMPLTPNSIRSRAKSGRSLHGRSDPTSKMRRRSL